MGGGNTAGFKPYGPFVPPKIKGTRLAAAIGSVYWFFLGYRMYHDGGHHFVRINGLIM
jgi:hypothetical protein